MFNNLTVYDIGPHGLIANRWYGPRCIRFQNDPTSHIIDPENPARHWHRRCPRCDGHGMIEVRSTGYYDPPDSAECPVCDTVGRVSQAMWEQAIADLKAEPDYEYQYESYMEVRYPDPGTDTW